ncbi:transposase [Halomonas sp.]|uniref:transposase n=1 Tax=Halomonas sp. TaxID=1486246 RepID=UPI0038602C41
MTVVLHTWCQNLSQHVHLHCLIPAVASEKPSNLDPGVMTRWETWGTLALTADRIRTQASEGWRGDEQDNGGASGLRPAGLAFTPGRCRGGALGRFAGDGAG